MVRPRRVLAVVLLAFGGPLLLLGLALLTSACLRDDDAETDDAEAEDAEAEDAEDADEWTRGEDP